MGFRNMYEWSSSTCSVWYDVIEKERPNLIPLMVSVDNCFICSQSEAEVEYVAEDEFEESDLSDMEVCLFDMTCTDCRQVVVVL